METANIKLKYKGHGRFVADCDYETREAVRAAGFDWDSHEREWFTNNFKVAACLRDFADESTKARINRVIISVTPWTTPLHFPIRLTPTPYQIEAARFVLERNRSYLGMAAGLGKTIVAAIAMNSLMSRGHPVFVYVCPSSLVNNVENELSIWSPAIDCEHYDEPKLFGNLLLVPDSLFQRDNIFSEIKGFVERLKRQNYYPKTTQETVLFVDEAHRFKDDESGRTRVLFGHDQKPGIVSLFERVVFMSGDPMPNRPMELYPVLSTCAPQTIDFMSRDEFGLKFCAGRYDGYGYDFSGASNLRELAQRVQGTFMFRLRKDALPLPPLLEEVLVVAENVPTEIADFEQHILREFSIEDLTKGALEREFHYQDMHLMTYQRLLGMKKIKHAVAWLKDFLEDTDEAVLIFARHTDVIDALIKECEKLEYEALVITGATPTKDRYRLVDQFQKTNCRIMIGNLRAMGLGFNITKATRILNLEPDWTPSTNNQGRDRAHRYGQTKTVLAQYMCFKNSVDQRVLNTVLRKTKLQSYI